VSIASSGHSRGAPASERSETAGTSPTQLINRRPSALATANIQINIDLVGPTDGRSRFPLASPYRFPVLNIFI
ncbi:MAG: hypothetical protein WD079_07710, partial [Phycisphaeraceae bacterium]